MADPTTTARASRVPAGIALGDGFSTTIAFASNPTVKFFEKTVTPPGYDGGDAVERTNMHNTLWRTFSPRNLITLTECSTTVQYDPDLYDEISTLINTEDSITIHFPDESTLAFYGYLRVFDPGELVEGTPPEADITIQPTNWDYTNKVEAGPVMTEVAGT